MLSGNYGYGISTMLAAIKGDVDEHGSQLLENNNYILTVFSSNRVCNIYFKNLLMIK